MRVLFVPSCSERAPAPRYRVYQYREVLDRHGVGYRIFPAVSDFTTRLMLASPTYGDSKKRLYYGWVLAERLARFLPILYMARHHDVVFLQRATFFGLEGLLRKMCDRVVFDFDDAIFMTDADDGEKSWWGRLTSSMKALEVDRALRISRAAIVENQYLRRYAEARGAHVTLIPGPVDTDHFVPREKPASDTVTIGWIGTPSTARYLAALHPVLVRLAAQHDICFKTIGVEEHSIPGVKTINAPWTLSSELSELQSFDIGVMPMPDNGWTRGKLGLKMLLYMSVGLPSVVAYTPTNAEVIEDAENGFLADGEEAWFDRLSALIRDPALRRRLGEAARATIVERFSLHQGGDRLVQVLTEVAGADDRLGREGAS
jgi:glycosyltransferase involved in cell wall biosynthesis